MTTHAALYHDHQGPQTKLLAAHTPWLTSFSKRKHLGFFSSKRRNRKGSVGFIIYKIIKLMETHSIIMEFHLL